MGFNSGFKGLNWISNVMLPPAHNYETVRWIVTTHVLEHYGVAYTRFCRKCERPFGTEYENIWDRRTLSEIQKAIWCSHLTVAARNGTENTKFSSLSFRMYVHHIPHPPTDIWMKLAYRSKLHENTPIKSTEAYVLHDYRINSSYSQENIIQHCQGKYMTLRYLIL